MSRPLLPQAFLGPVPADGKARSAALVEIALRSAIRGRGPRPADRWVA